MSRRHFYRWYTLEEWLRRRGSGRKTVLDTERPCSICLLDFTNQDFMVVGPDGPGPSYMICKGCYQLHRGNPTEAFRKADEWVSTLTDGFGSQTLEQG